MSPDKNSFSIKSINNKQIICHGGNEFVFKIPQKDQTLLYRCVHASCSATLKLSRDKTSIVGGTFTHARHSPVGPSVKPAFRSSASERSSANTTPLSSSKSAKSSPLPRTPSGHNSTSSSSDFEFSTPLVKPPRNGTSLSTRASTYSFDSPPPSVPKSNSHDGLGSSSSHDTIVLKDDSFFPDVPENAQLLQRIDELVIQRDALIGKIQELSSKLEVNSSTTQVPKTDFSVNRIAIFSDSMCRGVSKIIHDKFCSSAKVSSLVKPNANFFQVTKNIPSLCKDFGTKDVIVIQAGTNDMSLLQPNSAKILPVKHFVHLASKTNIILCSVPYRYDNLAHLTTNIFETNSYVKYVCLDTYSAYWVEVARVRALYPHDAFFLFGDYNLPDISWNTDADFFPSGSTLQSSVTIEQVLFLDLRQRNLVPNHNGRILDLVFSSLHTDECRVLQCDPILPVDSHHPPLSFQCVFPVSDEVVDDDYHGFNFRKGDYNLINRTFFETDWRALLSEDSVEDNVRQFYLVVQDVIQLYVPSIHLKKDSYPIWYSPYLKNLIIQKKSVHRLYKSSSSPHQYAEFRRLRSLCKTVSDNCYAKYVSSAEGNIKENPRRSMYDAATFFNILHSKLDTPELLSTININIPTRSTRNPQPFNPPFVRANYLQNAAMIPATYLRSDRLRDLDLNFRTFQDGLTDRQDGLTDRRDGLTDRRDGLTDRRDGLTNRRDGLTDRRDGLTDRRDGLTNRRDGLTDRRDGLTDRRDGLTDRRDGLTDRRDGLTNRRDGLTDRRDGLTDRRDGLTDRRDGLTDRRDGLTDRRDGLSVSSKWFETYLLNRRAS
ncbi:hypothetical protein M8J77_010286 [Diaphorina citri]|nr:hypothetical protein M8J77_010286 [Diaphorina citri]